MERLEQIKKLSEVQHNIQIVEGSINHLKASEYYRIFSNEEQRQHDIQIQIKCLEYWKRRFNLIIQSINY